jgi:threonine dehydrogenase-like Zn-dependent dehydrogenase/Fe2+ transport system protein FeoA
MKQVLQNRKTGRPFVGEVPVPALQRGRVLVRTVASLISAGTERAAVELVSKGLVQEARQRPDLVKTVVAKVKNEGLLNTFASVRDKMAASQALGYSAAGIVAAVAEDVTEFHVGDRVACAGVGFASHAEVLSVPKNLCVHLPDGVSFESGAYGTLGAIALQGVRLAEPTLGESIVVIGLGLVGQLTVQLLKANGCRVFGLDGRLREGSAASRCDSCPLGVCAVGCQATILGISCPAGDAQRLRSLGLFEGARVGIIDTRSGMVLDIRGSRLALGWEIVAGITVCPVSA